MVLHVRNGRPNGVRILGPPLTGVSIVVDCLVSLSYSCHPIMDELISPCCEVSIIFTGKLVYLAFVSVLVIGSGDVKQGHIPLGDVCLISRVQHIILTSTGFISREDFNTSIWCCSWVDRSFTSTGLGLCQRSIAGPTATARSGTWAWWARGTLSWSAIGHWAPTRRGRTRSRVARRRRPGAFALGWRACCGRGGGSALPGEFNSVSPCMLGAVEVEAVGPMFTTVAALPPVLWRMASFSMSSAFLWLLVVECVPDPGYGAPASGCWA